MKKILLVLCVLIICFGISSCMEYEDLKPEESDYASWDGNYIYKGLYKSKTTGENEKQLMEYVMYNNHKYYIDIHNYTYLYYNDEIYFSFRTSSVKDESADGSFVVKYSPKLNDYEILFASPNELCIMYVEKVYGDYVYLLYDIPEENLRDILYINILTKEFGIIENIKDYNFLHSIIVFVQDGLIKVLNLVTLEINNIIKYTNSSILEYEVKEFGVVVFMINVISDDVVYDCLYTYNINTNECINLIDKEDNIRIDYIDNDYFMLYKKKKFEYVDGLFKKAKVQLNVENKLCKFNYHNSTYEVVYEFENADACYLGGYIKNNIYYMKQSLVKRGWFIFNGGEKEKSYQLDLNTLELKVDKFNTVDNKESILATVQYNNQIYYMEERTFGLYLGQRKAVYLYCKEQNKNNPMLMQFFIFEEDFVSNQYDGTRSAILMWNEGLWISSKSTMILNY